MGSEWTQVAFTAIVKDGMAHCMAPMNDYARSELDSEGGCVNEWWCIREGGVEIPEDDGMYLVMGRTTWWDRDEWPDGDAGAESEMFWLRLDGANLDVSALLELLDRRDHFEGEAMEQRHYREQAESRISELETHNAQD